jgi:hypothetical protein
MGQAKLRRANPAVDQAMKEQQCRGFIKDIVTAAEIIQDENPDFTFEYCSIVLSNKALRETFSPFDQACMLIILMAKPDKMSEDMIDAIKDVDLGNLINPRFLNTDSVGDYLSIL